MTVGLNRGGRQEVKQGTERENNESKGNNIRMNERLSSMQDVEDQVIGKTIRKKRAAGKKRKK